MASSESANFQELFKELTKAVADWEDSPYYLADDELFDLEGFLKDRNAQHLLKELERTYGTPLNNKFWSSSLAYHKLKRAREAIKSQGAEQDAKRKEHLEALERSRREWAAWVKEWAHSYQRKQLHLVKSENKDPPH